MGIGRWWLGKEEGGGGWWWLGKGVVVMRDEKGKESWW